MRGMPGRATDRCDHDAHRRCVIAGVDPQLGILAAAIRLVHHVVHAQVRIPWPVHAQRYRICQLQAGHLHMPWNFEKGTDSWKQTAGHLLMLAELARLRWRCKLCCRIYVALRLGREPGTAPAADWSHRAGGLGQAAHALHGSAGPQSAGATQPIYNPRHPETVCRCTGLQGPVPLSLMHSQVP